MGIVSNINYLALNNIMSMTKVLNEMIGARVGSAVLIMTGLFLGSSYALANHNEMPDADEDGFISVAEGVPFYGAIVHSLTTGGDVSAGSALALDRFPVADDDGEYEYERTFTIADEISDLTEAHIVIHGIDLNGNGEYDGEKESSIAAGVPFEATVPSACGVIEFDEDGEYEVDIKQLNSSGAHGEAELTLEGDQLTVELEMGGVSPDIAHAQHVHLGGDGVCPPNTLGAGGHGDEGDGSSDDRFADLRARIIKRQIEQFERVIERIESRIERLQDRLEELR